MKHFYLKTVKKFGFLYALLFLSSGAFAALSGSTYTIDKTSAASATNYQSFASFVSDLKSGTRADLGTPNGPGVSGAVVVNVVKGSGPYTEQVSLTAITGASASNTITIMGNGVTLEFTATSTTNAHTIKLDGTDYFIIDGLDIACLSSSIGRGIWLTNSADYNVIRNCTLRMPNMSSTSSNNAYICLTTGTSSMTTYGDPGEENLIQNNTMYSGVNLGPYSGIAVVNESSGSTVHANTIRDNNVKDWYYAGIWGYYPFAQKIVNNEIHNTGSSRSSNKYGIYMYNYNKGGDHVLDSNYIHDLSTYSTAYWYGIYNYAYYGTGNNGISISGNRIVNPNSTYYMYSIYNYAYNNYIYGDINVANNDIRIEYKGSSYYVQYGIYNYCYYTQNASSVNILGNHVEIKSNVYAYGIMNYVAYGYYSKDCYVANNIIDVQANYYAYGIYTYAYGLSTNVHYVHNTLYSDDYASGTKTGYGYLYYPYYCNGDFKNNILVAEDNGGNLYAIYYYPGGMKFDYNNLYIDKSSATIQFYNGSSSFTTFADYKTGMGGANDISLDPKFLNVPNGDFTPSEFKMVNKGTPTKITKDIYGATRNSTNPDIGAIEFTIDVAMSNLSFSQTNVCGGYKENVTITITNNNTINITGIPVAYDVNGERKVSEVCNVTIKAGKSYDYTFSKPVELNFPGTVSLNVYLDGSDDNTSNNVVSKSVNVTSSPYGAELAEGSSFPGYFRQGGSGGSMTNPDVTIPGAEIVYDIQNPTNLSNSTYGSTWTMAGYYMTSGGAPVTSGATYTAPSGSNMGTVKFNPSTSLMDSLIFIGVKATSITTGCDSIFGRWVYVPHVPKVDFSFKPACDGEVIEFKNLTTLAKGNMLYEWQFNDPNSTEDATDVSDPIYKYVTFGTYNADLNIHLRDYPKFSFTKSYPVTVTPVPTIDFKVYNACEGLPINFVNNTTLPAGIVGTISYVWNFGGAGAGDNVTTKSPKYTYSKAGGYQVTLTATSNGCASTVTKNANQFAKPKASFTKSGNCNFEEMTFTNKSTISIGNTGNTWYFGDGDISNLREPKHIYQTAGSKSVKLVTTSEFGCKDSSIVTFTLNESPKADFTYSDPCNLTATQFTRTGTKPTGVNSVYEWDFSGEAASTNENPSHMFSSIGMKDITLIVRSANGCADMITKSFPVKLQAKADFLATDVCEGEDVSFTNKSYVAAGELAYEWRLGDGNKSNKTSPKHAYAATGSSKTFLVTLVANVPGGCSDSVTRPVNVNAKADASFTKSGNGRTFTFTQTTTDASNAYNWRFGDGGRSQTINPTYVYENVDKGSFQACLGIINAAGCLSESCTTVNIDLVGVEDLDVNGITVYPNPSTGKFNLNLEKVNGTVSIKVFNLLGELVNTNINETALGQFSFDLSHASNGVYMVQVTNGTTIATKRVTISH